MNLSYSFYATSIALNVISFLKYFRSNYITFSLNVINRSKKNLDLFNLIQEKTKRYDYRRK